MRNATVQARRAMAMTLGFDLAAAAGAILFAIYLRWLATGTMPPNPLEITILSGLLFPAMAGIAFFLLRVHRQVWRHMGAGDVMQVLQAVGLTALLFLPTLFLWNRLEGFPRSSLPIALVVWLLIMLAGRMYALSRSTHRPLQLFTRVHRDAPAAILVGDTEAAASALRDIQASPGAARLRILGLVQLGRAEPGRAIRGVTVLGHVDELGYVLDVMRARYGEVPWVAVTGKARSPRRMRSILETAATKKTKVMALNGANSTPQLQDLRPADLLARAERNLDMAAVKALVQGRRVLVTGGGGTIGSELARQVADLEPARLTILDASEYAIYRSEMTLRRTSPGLEMNFYIGDVRDVTRVEQVCRSERPDIVFHAAALKHVPLMERHVCEAILTNVAGCINVARAAVQTGTRHMVFISTDKAVDPDNVMGATKRIAEIAAARIGRQAGMTVSLVRFGNVLGSSGSVVPLFNEQIEAGGPVTVTHPDVTRYFMTVEEAAALTLQAAALQEVGDPPSLYVLDMGEPIRIEALAEEMIRLRGLVPGVDIEIAHTGLRPGEKLHESLAYDFEDIAPTRVDGVLRVRGVNGVTEDFDLTLASLLRAANRREHGEALRLLGRLVPQYDSNRVRTEDQAAGA